MIKRIIEILFKLVVFNKQSEKIRSKIFSLYLKGYSSYAATKLMKCGSSFSVEAPFFLKNGSKISIGDNCFIHRCVRLEAWSSYLGINHYPEISIGNDVIINHDCHIGAINKISIGNSVLIASKVFITDHFHGDISSESILLSPKERKLYSKGEVIIEDNVWIGEGVCIMPNVRIGKNSIIGANSVVTKDIPDNSVVAGVPAKILKILH